MKNCTIYQDIYDHKNPKLISIDKALERIKSGKSKEKIEILRAEKDSKKQDAVKKSLPCVVFSGIFNVRRDDAILEYSNFIILDFDKVENIAELKHKLVKFESSYAV